MGLSQEPARKVLEHNASVVLGGGLRPCFEQLDASDQLDLRAQRYGGDRSLNTESHTGTSLPAVGESARLEVRVWRAWRVAAWGLGVALSAEPCGCTRAPVLVGM